MDPAAVGLLSGGLGVLGTLAGVLLTQWRSDVRERLRLDADERREQHRLSQEADKSREERLFDHRRNAYLAVIEHYHRWINIAADIRGGVVPEPPEDAMDTFWRAVSDVDLFGSVDTAERAQALYSLLHDQVYGPRNLQVEDMDLDLDAADHQNDFVDAARADLGLPARWPGRLDIDVSDSGTRSQ